MKHIFRSLLILFCLSFVCLAAEEISTPTFHYSVWTGAPTDWKVEAKLENKEYQVNRPVALHLTMRNVTDTAKTLVSTYPFQDYWIEVKSADGVVVAYTELVAKLRRPNPQMLSILSPRIEPGAMWKLTINLAEYFELAKPGNYFVSVRRHYSWRGMHSDGKVVPKQNPNDPKAIPFTVTP